MATIRVARRRRYTSIDRRAINDTRLSFRARGVLHWLLDKPDDWRIDSTAIARESDKEGREAIRTALRELADVGYLVTRKVQGKGGRWSTETTVYEDPADAEREEPVTATGAQEPDAGSPDVGSPDVGSPGALPLEGLTPKTETSGGKAPAKERKRRWSEEAEGIARVEWERRPTKPVCGWPAFCTRIQDALDAGHPAEAIAATLPRMTTFSRDAFDFALNGRSRPAGPRGTRPLDQDRSAPSGRVDVR